MREPEQHYRPNGPDRQMKMFHVTAPEYTFFSTAQRTFSKINHRLAHKTDLNKFKKIKIIQSIFSDLNRLKLEINRRRKKNTNWNHGKISLHTS